MQSTFQVLKIGSTKNRGVPI